MGFAMKKGFSMKKIMSKFNLNNLPFTNSEDYNTNRESRLSMGKSVINLTQALSKPKKEKSDKKERNKGSNLKSVEEEMGRSKNDGFNTIIETKSSEEKKSMHQEKVVVVEKKEDTMKSNKQLVGEENERLTESKYLSSQKKRYFLFFL